jgi:hypothetical protein
MEMDFKSGIAEIEAAEEEELPPKNFGEKVWRWLVRLPVWYRIYHYSCSSVDVRSFSLVKLFCAIRCLCLPLLLRAISCISLVISVHAFRPQMETGVAKRFTSSSKGLHDMKVPS